MAGVLGWGWLTPLLMTGALWGLPNQIQKSPETIGAEILDFIFLIMHQYPLHKRKQFACLHHFQQL